MQSFQVLQETPQYTVSSYGASLPVLITETLLQADRSAVISVQLDQSGWGCFVCGRKLFVWRFKQAQVTRSSQCYRLALPASELCHSAKLVCLFPGQLGAPSVMAVSPEGVIRFWASLHNELAFYERGLDLSGQECFSVTHLEDDKCLLATTSNQMILLSVSSQNMQTQVEVHNLKPSHGMFARVSSLIFGYSKSHTAQIRRVCAGAETAGGREVYVLHDEVLQKWLISQPGQETVIYEKQLGTVLLHHFQREFGLTSADGLKTWLLDVQPTNSSVLLLAAVTNVHISSPKLHYALVEMKAESSLTEGQDPVEAIHMADKTLPYRVPDEVALLDCHLLLPSTGHSSSFIYGKNILIGCLLSPDVEPSFQEISLTDSRTSIWGAGSIDGQCMFFNSAEGLVAVRLNEPELPSMDESIVGQSRLDQSSRLDRSRLDHSRLDHSRLDHSRLDHSRLDQSVHDVSPFEQSISQSGLQNSSLMVPTPRKMEDGAGGAGSDNLTGLKTAFLCFCRSQLTQAEKILEDLFPTGEGADGYTDSSLDRAVEGLSLQLINDFPPADPRWAESVPQDSVSASGSLFLMHQLEDKMKAHSKLILFLKNSGIWERLHSVAGEDYGRSTHAVLGEHIEKLAAAKALFSQHLEHANLIDAAISRVTNKDKLTKLPSGLTLRDVFYTEASEVQQIFRGLQEEEEDLLRTDFNPRDSVTLISNINTVYQAVLREAWQVHESKALVYQPPENSGVRHPYQPWTASSGPKGLRALISQQHNLTIQHGINNVEDDVSRSNLFQLLFNLTELQLDGFWSQLESLRDSVGEDSLEYGDLEQKYLQERQALIKPFVKFGQTERAASLAEKFQDFGTLVELCDGSGTGQMRLRHYMDYYTNQGFSDFVFKYYIDRGQRGKLMTHFAHRPELGDFLRQHDHISWLQDIQTNNFSQAHVTLKKLAEKEQLSIAKKKTLLSLSKLSALAADEPVDLATVEGIDGGLLLIQHQEQLPSSVLQRLHLDVAEMPVMEVDELIELYTGDKNIDSNEYDFMKALDLLMDYISKDDPRFLVLQRRIWSRAILKDSWDDPPGADPYQFCRETVFFKMAMMAMHSYSDRAKEEFLPSPDELLRSEELAGVRDSRNFQFLLRLGMEKLNQS